MALSLPVTSFLPYLELPALPDHASVQLRETGGKITVLVTLHSAECAGCREYIDSLSPLAAEFDEWDARLLVIVPGSRGVPAPFGRVLSDVDSSIADPASASVIVADRYGQIFAAVPSGASHELPPPRELVEWLKFIGTLCPE